MTLERKLHVIVRDYDSIVDIELYEDGLPVSSTGITDCDIAITQPGQDDVVISSADEEQAAWFDLQYEAIVNGREIDVIRVNFADIASPPANGRFQCRVYLYDQEYVDGRFWGTFDVEIRGAVAAAEPVAVDVTVEIIDGSTFGFYNGVAGSIAPDPFSIESRQVDRLYQLASQWAMHFADNSPVMPGSITTITIETSGAPVVLDAQNPDSTTSNVLRWNVSAWDIGDDGIVRTVTFS